jgi:hypothetical protein
MLDREANQKEDDADQQEYVEEILLENVPSDEVGSRECRLIVKGWIARAQESGGAERHWDQLQQACEILKSIRDACWSNWLPEDEARVPQTLWAWPNDNALVQSPKEWMEKSPADTGLVDHALADYLKRPWLRDDTIDLSAINALLFTDLALLNEEVKSGRPFGKINWSYFFSGGNPLKQMGLSLLGRVIGFLMAWAMLPAISVALAAYGYPTAAAWVIGIWALYVLYRICIIPARLRLRKARRETATKANEILTAMNKAWQFARGQTINPSRLRDLVIAAEQSGAQFQSVLHTLLDRAIQRDPTAMTRL